MAVTILQVAVLLGTGVAAGVLFAVALSVLPALFAMPAGRYVETHRLIGQHWDPTMPVIVMGTTVLQFVLVVLDDSTTSRLLFAIAGLLLAGVSTVSHLCNVPINRVVKKTDPSHIPPDWHDPRPLWRRWHTLRTSLAFAALVATAVGVTAS